MPLTARVLLMPDSDRGWFGGRRLVLDGPVDVVDRASVADAADALGMAFRGDVPTATVAVLRYEGDATILRFERPSREAGPLHGDAVSGPVLLDAVSDMGAQAYMGAVEAVRRRIASGDVYVLNLTTRLEGWMESDPGAAFATLHAQAGSAMSALLELPSGSALVSVSPERFLRVRADSSGERTVSVSPIKGTRPRGLTPAGDAASAAALAADPKERAEHVMVVDLERNDLGRVCVPGSVRVDPFFEVVRTPYCHQLVSSVHGVLRPDASIGDLLFATFPCGSVTGAPKIAAVRIAASLERTPRGAYCGALVVAIPGEIDSSVLIRTLECDPPGPDGKRRARWGSGCGITYDSDPSAEWDEVVLKASPAVGGAPATRLA